MIEYVKSNFVALVIVECFGISGDGVGVFTIDEFHCPDSDSSLSLFKGDHMEYVFTRDDGYHFVIHETIGFWVHPDLVEIKEKRNDCSKLG